MVKTIVYLFLPGLAHTQGIQKNSGNFQVEEKLREFWFIYKLREVLIFSEELRESLRF